MTLDVLLVSPPFWDPYAPSAANPALLGYLRAQHLSGAQIDINQAYFRDRLPHVVAGALVDVADPEILMSRVPTEHRVVMGLSEAQPDLLRRWDIPEETLSLEGFRSAIRSWKRLDALNVVDALIHYGYFVRHDPAIAGVLQDRSCLDDPAWEPMKRLVHQTLLPRLERERPGVLGLSILGEQQFAASVAITHWVREAGFAPLIVWGGSQIRAIHTAAREDGCWWRRLPDLLVLGEGETALATLAQRSREARRSGEPGWAARLTFDRKPNEPNFVPGTIAQPLERVLVAPKRYEEVTTLAAYDFDGLDLHDSYLMPWPTIPYQGSRGCHWGLCGFCDHEEGYRLHYRPKESEQVVENLMAYRSRFGIEHIQFVDEAIEPSWLYDLNDELEKRSLGGVFRWSNYSKVSVELDADLLGRTYANGGRLILFGVESFNQRVLNVVKKGIRRKDALATIRATHDAGIRSWIWLIAGLPTQTPEELAGDIADLRSLEGFVDAVSVGRYRISENSDIYREMSKYGIVEADLNHPMDVRYTSSGDVVDHAEIARLYYEEYYPQAIGMSLTHNRYLLFADALKRERAASPGVRGRRPRPAISGAARTREVLGNI
ncbi:MAG: B12-binding domain-containing radical SAM protein [Dermatophilaceae bacterium]